MMAGISVDGASQRCRVTDVVTIRFFVAVLGRV